MGRVAVALCEGERHGEGKRIVDGGLRDGIGREGSGLCVALSGYGCGRETEAMGTCPSLCWCECLLDCVEASDMGVRCCLL